MGKILHPLQEKINKIYTDTGSLPPFRKLAKMIGVSSTNTVAYHVNKLKESGYLAIERTENGVVRLNIKNILSFENKSGVFVLLKNKSPFYVGAAENLKAALLDVITLPAGSPVLDYLREHDNINIAYYFTADADERKNLKDHLDGYYSKQGIKLF